MDKLDQLKKAYEILGLPENATREQVENRYFILMKKVRYDQARQEGNPSQEINLEEINQAYNLVIGIESEKSGTIEKQSKLAHFMYYYKFHVIITIIIVLLAGYSIKEGIDKRREAANLPPASSSISVFGNFYFANVEKLEQNMLEIMPDWQRIEFFHTYVPTEIRNEQDMALQQKSVLSLITEKPNLYILDRANFDSLARQGALIKLEELEGWETLQVDSEHQVNGQMEEDPEPVAYGIDVTGHPIFEGADLQGDELILGVRIINDKWPDTLKLLDKLLQDMP